MVLVIIWSGCRSEVVVVFERPKAATTLSVSAGGNEFTVSYTPPASSAALSTVAVGTLGNESPSSLRIARGLSDLSSSAYRLPDDSGDG